MKKICALLFCFFAQNLYAATDIDFWHSMAGAKGKLLEDLVADFNKSSANTGKFNVKLQFVGSYDEGINKLRTSLMGGKAPHIVQIYEIGTKVLIDSKAIRPLQDFIDKDKDFPSDQLLPQILSYYQLDGKLYSLPFATSNPIIYYNMDLFEKAGIKTPPKDFAELKAVAEKLTNPKEKITGITWPLHSWLVEQAVARQGVALLNNGNGRSAPATEANYLSPEATGFITLWKEMVTAGTFANVGRGWDPAEQNFLAGRSAMLITSTSNVFDIVKDAKFRIGTAPMVKAKLDQAVGGTVVGGNSLWILASKPEAEQQGAWQFMKYMASKDVQSKWHQNTGYFPIRKDVIAELEKSGFYKKNPNARTAIDQLLSSEQSLATSGALMGVFPEARDHIETAVEEILNNKATMDVALKKAKSRTEASLTRYNKLNTKR
jgi:sn-glycerol 3-phosphate transport system substrate-binding protein